MFKFLLSSFLVVFANKSLARISPLPNDFMPLILICTDLTSNEIVAEVYEKSDSSKSWVGFITDDGDAGLLSVVRIEDGFKTKNGELNNLRLLHKEGSVYQLSLHAANLDGSNGEADIIPVDVNCSAPAE